MTFKAWDLAFLLEYVKLSSFVDIVRSKVNITKFFINATLRGVSYYMAVPDIEKYCGR